MMLIGDFFHIGGDRTFITVVKRREFKFKFPIFFDLYDGEQKVEKIQLEGMVMDDCRNFNDIFEFRTFWVHGLLDKKIIEGKINAYLSLSNKNDENVI